MNALVIDFAKARKAAEAKERAAKRAKPTKRMAKFWQRRDAVRAAAQERL